MINDNFRTKIIKNLFISLLLIYVSKRKKIVSFLYGRKLKNIKGTVIIRLDAIGDFILSMDAIEKIAENHQDSKITLICSDSCYELAQRINCIDKIILMDFEKYKTNRRYRKDIDNILKAEIYENLYNIQYTRNAWLEVLICKIKSRRRYAFNGENFLTEKWKKITNRNYNFLIECNQDIFELEKNIFYVNQILHKNYSAQIYCLTSNYVEKNTDKYYIVFPGGSYQEKMWETKKFSKLLNWIATKEDIKCIICGTENEQNIINEICCDLDGRYEISIGLSFDVLIGKIASSKYVIGNDSMGIHLALAVGIPAIVLAGGWNGKRFLEYKREMSPCGVFPTIIESKMECFGCENANRGLNAKACGVQRGFGTNKYSCISSISVEMVIKAMKRGGFVKDNDY